jgi:hypothetical protein
MWNFNTLKPSAQRVVIRHPTLNFQHPATIRPAISLCAASRRLEIFMNRDPRCALSQELEAKQTLLDQLRALATDDPDFFADLIAGETNLLELIAALDASIVADEILADGAKAALDKLQTRKLAAENRSLRLASARVSVVSIVISPSEAARGRRPHSNVSRKKQISCGRRSMGMDAARTRGSG